MVLSMVVKLKKKNKRQRGKRWHGYGSKKKHRGKGSKGGKGRAGMHKHKWSYVVNKSCSVFGYKGFKSIKKKGRVMNLNDLNSLVASSGKKTIDLNLLGVSKLLGRGNVAQAIQVKVKMCSDSAKQKLEKAGGKVLQ